MSLDPTKVFETARSLLPGATVFLKKTGLDPSLAEDFLMESASKVIERSSSEVEIQNLPAYLFTSFKNLALQELRKHQRYEDLSDDQFRSLSDRQTAATEMQKEILREEIVRRLSAEDKFILNYRLLDYSYKEISELFKARFGKSIAENVLRSRFSKTVQRLAKDFGE